MTEEEVGQPDPEQSRKYERLVAQIAARESAGQEALYNAFRRSVRIYFAHRLQRQDVEDKVHDTFVAIIAAIQGGQLREPRRLPGFVRTVARRQLAGYIAQAVRRRSESAEIPVDLQLGPSNLDPEEHVVRRERAQLAKRILADLPKVDREILERFYFDGQTAEQICEQLGLTETQFRLRKSRAKERITQMMRKALRRGKLFGEFLLRKQTAAGH